MKKIISILLSSVILFVSFSSINVNAVGNNETRLYNYYTDKMLFKQNDEAIFAGVSAAGNEISVELFDTDGICVRSSRATADGNGTFRVSFVAPEGGFTEYTAVLNENGQQFAKLEQIVFGELWIAAGQSNMSYPLAQSKTGIESISNNESFNKWVRALMIPYYPQNGTENDPIPANPQTEYYNAEWVSGDTNGIYGASAVGYYFADKLVNELQMPVGFLNTSLGGSCLVSWLSREAIEGSKEIMRDFQEFGDYIKLSEWKENKQNIYGDMTANFNTKIAPLSNFRVSGMIWYQGESDIHPDWNSERFNRTFKLLQESYTDHFGYKDGLLPVVCTQIAPFTYYSDTALAQRNIDFADLHYERPDSIAVTSIHDIPLTYTPLVGGIHPECKLEVGERMAFAAMGLVYGKRDVYSTATAESSDIKDGSIFVKLKNVGDGLSVKGDVINCFTICGNNGIYLPAEAEIVSEDTVRVFNDLISDPVSVAYAYCATNFEANLYATENSELTLPVSPFITDPSYNKHAWIERFWDDCEQDKIWHSVGNETTGYYPSWTSENAKISFTTRNSYSGKNGMGIVSDYEKFSVKPIMTFMDEDGSLKRITDNDHDYTDYGTMSFFVRNNGTEDILLSNVTIGRDLNYFYSPAISGTSDISAVIPADGEWHQISVNLNKLYLNGNDCGIAITNKKLVRTTDIIFNFEGNGKSDISLDHIRFSAEEGNEKASFDVNPDNANTFFEKISYIFTVIIGFIAEIFI